MYASVSEKTQLVEMSDARATTVADPLDEKKQFGITCDNFPKLQQ